MAEDPKRNQEGPGKKPKSEEPTRPALEKKPKSEGPTREESEEPTRAELEDDVEEKKKKLDAAQKKLDDFNAANKEIDKAVEDYGKAFEKFKMERYDLDDYITKKSLMICAVMDKTKRDKIDEMVKTDIEKSIKDAAANSGKAFEKAKIAYEVEVNTLKKFQDAYESAKGFQKEIETRLKTLDNNRKSIEQEEEDKNYTIMYYLNDIESKAVLEGLKTSCENLKKLMSGEIPGDEPGRQKFIDDAKNEFRDVFKNKLNEARNALEEQENELKLEEKKEAMQTAEKAYNEAQKALAELNKDRKSKILEKLREIKFTEEV